MNILKVNASLFTMVLFAAMPARSPAQQEPSEIGQEDAREVRAFVAQLQDPNAEVRWKAARSLCDMKEKHLSGQVMKDVVLALSEALSSDSLRVYHTASALESLGRKANETVPALEKALASREHPLYKHKLATALVAVHSTVDFSLQNPAVAATYALLMGAAVAQSWGNAE